MNDINPSKPFVTNDWTQKWYGDQSRICMTEIKFHRSILKANKHKSKSGCLKKN